MNTTDNIVISTQGLTKAFKGVNALKSRNLTVRRIRSSAFGPKGAGSDDDRLLLGLRPTSGSAYRVGQDIARNSVAIRRHVGYLAQEPHYYEHLTARLKRTANV
jgi:ABC-2 type transport system ATP-binding protein